MISPLAHIEDSVKLGNNVTVEPFACITGNVTIGDNCYIHSHAVIMDGATIGNNCTIHSGAVISNVPQDLKFKGEETFVKIGNNTTIRECATVNRGTSAVGVTSIGDNCLIMAYVHVGHDSTIGNNCILVNRVSLAGEVVIEDWAILGGHVAVHQFSRIGAHSMVSGGTMINKDIPPYVKCAHAPVTFVGLNTVGLRRRGFDNQQISDIQEIARILYQSGLPYSKGCEMVEQTIAQSDYRDEILSFIRSSNRGVLRQYQPKMREMELD